MQFNTSMPSSHFHRFCDISCKKGRALAMSLGKRARRAFKQAQQHCFHETSRIDVYLEALAALLEKVAEVCKIQCPCVLATCPHSHRHDANTRLHTQRGTLRLQNSCALGCGRGAADLGRGARQMSTCDRFLLSAATQAAAFISTSRLPCIELS